jgi:hypothetical protein
MKYDKGVLTTQLWNMMCDSLNFLHTYVAIYNVCGF